MSNRDVIVIGGPAGATQPLKQIPGRPCFHAWRPCQGAGRKGIGAMHGAEGRRSGRAVTAEMYGARAVEYGEYADMIRRVVQKSLDPSVGNREA